LRVKTRYNFPKRSSVLADSWSPRPPKKPVASLPQPVAPKKNRSDRSIAGTGRGGLFCCSFPTGISRGHSDEMRGSDRSFPKSIGPADLTDRSGRPPSPHRSKVATFLRLPLRKKIDRTDRLCMLAGPSPLPGHITFFWERTGNRSAVWLPAGSSGVSRVVGVWERQPPSLTGLWQVSSRHLFPSCCYRY